MTREHFARARIYRGAYLLVSLAVLLLDQWTKGIVTRTFDVHQSRDVVAELFDLTYVRNSGAAFGLFASVDSSLKAILLNSVAVLVFLIVSAYALRSSHKSVRLQVGLALILGGAVGTCSTACASATSSTSWTSPSPATTGPRSTSRTPRSASGVALLFLDMLRSEEEDPARPGPAAAEIAYFPAAHPDRLVLPSDVRRLPGLRLSDGIWLLRRKALATACPSRRSWTSRSTFSPPRSWERSSSSSSSSGSTTRPTRGVCRGPPLGRGLLRRPDLPRRSSASGT